MSKIAFLFPGQSSEFLGMAAGVLERMPGASRLLQEARDLLGWDVAGLLRQDVAMPVSVAEGASQAASFVANAICWEFWKGQGLKATALAGYSLGFYSALMAAGVFPFSLGLTMVREAGRLMAEAAASRPGRMAAIVGLLEEEVDRICQEVRAQGVAVAANLNASRQMVISGDEAAVQEACGRALAQGALEVKDLGVRAAYHSPLMEAPSLRFAAFLKKVALDDPRLPVLSYVDVQYVADGEGARDLLSRQLRSRIRWKDCVERLMGEGVDTFIEVGPGQMLTRLTRWIDRKVKAYATDDPLRLAMVLEGAIGPGRPGDEGSLGIR